jgi:oligopeptidase A
MLAADAFSAVQEVGLDNKEEVKKVSKRWEFCPHLKLEFLKVAVAFRFRSTFLSLGSSLPAAEIFRQFRGRDPSHEALLLSLGLKGITKPKKKGHVQEVV